MWVEGPQSLFLDRLQLSSNRNNQDFQIHFGIGKYKLELFVFVFVFLSEFTGLLLCVYMEWPGIIFYHRTRSNVQIVERLQIRFVGKANVALIALELNLKMGAFFCSSPF